MGLLNILEMNEVPGIKLLWKVLNRHGLCGEWILKKRVNGKSLWELDINNSFSCTFKFMLLLRNKELNVSERRIVDGKSTKIWYDPWLNGGNLLTMLRFQSLTILGRDNFTVHRNISNGNWECYNLPHTQNLSNEISEVKIYTDRTEDYGIVRIHLMETFNSNKQGKISKHQFQMFYGLRLFAIRLITLRCQFVFTRHLPTNYLLLIILDRETSLSITTVYCVTKMKKLSSIYSSSLITRLMRGSGVELD